MNNEKLFHIDVFMPEEFQLQAIKLQREFGQYSISEHLVDNLMLRLKHRSHDYTEEVVLNCIDAIKNNPKPAFEIQATNYDGKWVVTKYCVRVPIKCENNDGVVVVKPFYDRIKKDYDQTKNKIITIWINSKRDKHLTLETDKYVKKEDWK